MKTVRLRRATRNRRRLYIEPPLQPGDVVIEKDTRFTYLLESLVDGRATWSFSCIICGQIDRQKKNINYRPTKRVCDACKKHPN
jgi:hypothetical protein